jgi:hypothetical protein
MKPLLFAAMVAGCGPMTVISEPLGRDEYSCSIHGHGSDHDKASLCIKYANQTCQSGWQVPDFHAKTETSCHVFFGVHCSSDSQSLTIFIGDNNGMTFRCLASGEQQGPQGAYDNGQAL